MNLILDSSALLSGRLTSLPAGFEGVHITSSIRREISRGNPGRLLTGLLDAGMRITDPADTSKARKAASRTGDFDELSDTDLEIISLAIELDDPMVITDDFRIQNVLSHLNIEFRPAGEIGERTIRETWQWHYRCRGCGRYYDEKIMECPVCGSSIRPVKRR
jgi:UPF0271 protein